MHRVWLLSRSFSPVVPVIRPPLQCLHVRISFFLFSSPDSMLYGGWCLKQKFWTARWDTVASESSDESGTFSFYIHHWCINVAWLVFFPFSFITFFCLRKVQTHFHTNLDWIFFFFLKKKTLLFVSTHIARNFHFFVQPLHFISRLFATVYTHFVIVGHSWSDVDQPSDIRGRLWLWFGES